MEPEGSLPYSQVPATCPYLEPTPSSPHDPLQLPEHQSLYYPPIYTVFMCCICLRANSDLCHLHNELIGFYNRDEKCLQRGTDWVFK
jgi:hypothetical protein